MREKKSFDGRNSVRCLRCGDILFKGKEAKEAELICRKCNTVFYMWMHENALLLIETGKGDKEALDHSISRLIHYGQMMEQKGNAQRQ